MNKLSDNKIYSYIKACEKIVRNETTDQDKLVVCERWKVDNKSGYDQR